MSALGQKQTFVPINPMSALRQKRTFTYRPLRFRIIRRFRLSRSPFTDHGPPPHLPAEFAFIL